MNFRGDVEVYPRCGGEMLIIAFVTEHAGITRIRAHLERYGIDARGTVGEGGGVAAERRGACGAIEWSGRELPAAGGRGVRSEAGRRSREGT